MRITATAVDRRQAAGNFGRARCRHAQRNCPRPHQRASQIDERCPIFVAPAQRVDAHVVAGAFPQPGDIAAGQPHQRLRPVHDLNGGQQQLPCIVTAAHVGQLMDQDGIAALTGAGEETVKSRLRYATAKLRAALEDLR